MYIFNLLACLVVDEREQAQFNKMLVDDIYFPQYFLNETLSFFYMKVSYKKSVS